MTEGLVWVDEQAEEPAYWFPSLFAPQEDDPDDTR